jgi:hypothetical protein
MNKLILALGVFFTCTSANANILRCNNNPGISGAGIYSTVQAAHNAASAGDTIHLEPSAINYGSLTMTKRLFVVSTGAFLASNPGMQHSLVSGTVSDIGISNTAANNSVISCSFSSNISIGGGVSGVEIRNCYYTSWTTYTGVGIIYLANCSNILVAQNAVFGIDLGYLGNATGNVVVTNNLCGAGIGVPANCNATVEQNIFYATSNVLYNAGTINNCVYRNNINVNGYNNFTNCTVANNINTTLSGGTLPIGNGNQNSVVTSSIFVTATGSIASASSDNNFALKPTSTAVGAGFGGTDIGIFGGTVPYRLALQPRIPAITNITAPAVPTTNTINVTFSAKSN